MFKIYSFNAVLNFALWTPVTFREKPRAVAGTSDDGCKAKLTNQLFVCAPSCAKLLSFVLQTEEWLPVHVSGCSWHLLELSRNRGKDT